MGKYVGFSLMFLIGAVIGWGAFGGEYMPGDKEMGTVMAAFGLLGLISGSWTRREVAKKAIPTASGFAVTSVIFMATAGGIGTEGLSPWNAIWFLPLIGFSLATASGLSFLLGVGICRLVGPALYRAARALNARFL